MKRHGEWVCIGTLRPWSRWITGLAPEVAAARLRATGVAYKWIEEVKEMI